MKNSDANQFYVEADLLLSAADNEINRAEVDVVNYLICRNSRESIKNYLRGYLLNNGIEVHKQSQTLPGLRNQCMAINPEFHRLDFTPIKCRFEGETEDYCTSTDKIGECYQIALKTKELVLELDELLGKSN